MNFVHIESLVKAIYMIIFNKINEGEYCLKNNKFIKIQKLISTLNKKLKKKLKQSIYLQKILAILQSN